MEISKKALNSDFSPMRKFYKASVEAEARGVKIYHLNIGQPDIETPKEYFKAIKDFNNINDFYAPSQGIEKLLESIVNYYKSIGQHITKEDVLVTTGGSEALLFAGFCILNEGDEVLIPEPFYPNYKTIFQAVGGRIKAIETHHDEDYFYQDRSRIEPLITKKTKALLITNPNNPTGTIVNDKQIIELLKMCKEHNMYLICDEVYREICFSDEKKSESVLRFRDFDENVIVIDSSSKRFSACGARVGALISRNNDIIKNALKFAQARLSVSTLNQVGATALFSNITKVYTKELMEEYKRRRDIAVEELSKIKGVEVSVPKGAFYIMAKLPVKDADLFQEWLLTSFSDKSETVMFAPGACFYVSKGRGQNEIRIACVLKEKDLRRSIQLLAIALSKYDEEIES